ncbi:MAG: hypothetical protein KDC84_05930 [Crocinitomicaceae bacterium]|nr:hypothetical protein [Crocinitomicaceae bacterium]
MKNLLQLLLLTFFLGIGSKLNAGIVYSNGTGGGDWSSGSSWNPAAVPGCDDTIVISQGDLIEITGQIDLSGCSNPIYIVVHGTLSFPTNGPKLRLPCGSGVIMTSTGNLTANGSNGNANNITICGSTEWSAGDGDQGPGTLIGTMPPTVTSLSIRLKSFTGENVDDKNILYWSTETEINNDYFLLERTTNGFDYVVVAVVNGAGNSSFQLDYQVEDFEFEPNTINYYRLKSVDFDGVEEYSDVISIHNKSAGLPKLIGRYNLMGQSVTPEFDGIVIEHYDNGEVIKKYPIK